METSPAAVRQTVNVALGKQIPRGGAWRNPSKAPTAEEVLGALSAEAMVAPETRPGEERVGKAIAEERNAAGKGPPAGRGEGDVLLLPHTPAMALAVAVVGSVIAREEGCLERGKSRRRTSLTCSDSTTAWRSHQMKTARGGVTRGGEKRICPL